VFGYCGDVLFPTLVLSQVIEQIDQFILFNQGEQFEERVEIIQAALSVSLEATPNSQRRSFQVIYASRDLDGMKSEFQVAHIGWNKDNGWHSDYLRLPNQSDLIKGIGTGAESNSDWYSRWQRSDVTRTSRSVFSAFCEALRSGEDPLTGGAPQLVGIYRAGRARSFGVISNGKRYQYGHPVLEGDFNNIEWRNELFERCDGDTMQLLAGAQPQPSPIATGG